MKNPANTLSSSIFSLSSIKLKRRDKPRGFTLVELAAVGAILLIAAIIGIPMIGNILVERKAVPVGQDIQQFATRAISMSQGAADPATAFADVSQTMLASGMASSSALSVVGTNVFHGVGDSATGLVTMGVADSGQGFTLTLADVNNTACPSLASVMQRSAARISVNGTVVKNTTIATPVRFSLPNAAGLCTTGDTNDLIFTFGNYSNY